MTVAELKALLDDFSSEAAVDIHIINTDLRYSVLDHDADVDCNLVLYVGDLDE